VAVAALVAPICAALEVEVDVEVGVVPGELVAGATNTTTTTNTRTTLARLRDAGRTALPGGEHGALVDDLPRLRELGAAAASAVGEGTLRQMLGAAAGAAGGAASAAARVGLAVASGAGMLALSGALPRQLQPLDWAGMGVVGRCTLTPPDPQLKGAWYPPRWFQPLNLSSEKPVSK
jgi:hypothetical protein